jgi:hypothetical protein
MDLRKAKWSDVRKLSENNFNHFKRIFEEEEERRNEPKFELIDAIYFDDGCEGWYMTVDDFQECARKTDNHNDTDLIDVIENVLNNYGELHISRGKYTKDSFHNECFFSKENPYQKELDELEEDELEDE